MTRTEFVERWKVEERGSAGQGVVFLLVLIAAWVLWPWLTDQVNQWGVPWLVDLFKYPWVVFLLYVALFSVLAKWIRHRRGFGTRVVCANCHRVLTRPPYLAAIAVATGKCGKCGQNAFDGN
ncbi:MAG: hypothetical protein HYS12_26070 [Planctomycetes bacterium]|nr:hypothetical protein [Planctomycetota bacterium]